MSTAAPALYEVHYVRCVAHGSTVCDECFSRYSAPDLCGVDQSGVEWALAVSAERHVAPAVRRLCGGHHGVFEVCDLCMSVAFIVVCGVSAPAIIG